MTNPATQAEHAPAAAHEVEIIGNKRPVEVPTRTTGSEIKAKAKVSADDHLAGCCRIESSRK